MIEWPEVLEYAALVMNTCYPYHEQPKVQEMVESLTEQVNRRPAAELWRGVRAGDVADMLELALRSYAACGVPKSEFSPYELLDHVSPSTPPPLRARIFSFLAHVHFEARHVENQPHQADTTAVYAAAAMANRAAALDFVSPAVLLVAHFVECTGHRADAARFAALRDLWRVHDRRKAELAAEDEARARRVQREPHAYVCAARGCGVMGTRRPGLQRCAGQCARACKPAYCSKECQKKDWKRHKPFCGADRPVDEWVVQKGLNPASVAEPPAPQASSSTEEILKPARSYGSRSRENRIMAAGPSGRSMEFVSSTMSPAFMKEIQASLAQDAPGLPAGGHTIQAF